LRNLRQLELGYSVLGNLGCIWDAEGLAQEWDVDSRLARDDVQLDDLGVLGWSRCWGWLWCGSIAALAAGVDRLALASGAVQTAASNASSMRPMAPRTCEH